MLFDPPLIHGTLLRRYKRFLADVRLDDGTEITAHCPNPGSMKTCAEPGWGVWVSPANNPKRKLKWTLERIDAEGVDIMVNTARPNRIVEEAIAEQRVAELSGYSGMRAEVRYGQNSRIDLLLSHPGRADCYVEVKNVTMAAEPGVVAFPDSVSKRASKHMAELSDMVRQGHRAVVLFLVSRSDAEAMRPATEIDPAYTEALNLAVSAGVELLAYKLDFYDTSLSVGARIPIKL
jgi:sugar fermentation stimulation protein A